MLIDGSHRKWFVASVVILGLATVVFTTYALGTPQGVSGRRGFGLVCGIIGFLFMGFYVIAPIFGVCPQGSCAAVPM